jgi:hypothetical protein
LSSPKLAMRGWEPSNRSISVDPLWPDPAIYPTVTLSAIFSKSPDIACRSICALCFTLRPACWQSDGFPDGNLRPRPCDPWFQQTPQEILIGHLAEKVNVAACKPTAGAPPSKTPSGVQGPASTAVLRSQREPFGFIVVGLRLGITLLAGSLSKHNS